MQLAEDQTTKERVLNELKQKINARKEAYLLQKEMDETSERIKKFTNLAINFEEIIGQHLGPLQGVINEVTRVDESLFAAVQQIKDITEQMTSGNLAGSFDDQGDKQLLDFLVHSHLSGNALKDAISQATFVADDTQLTQDRDVERSIDNLKVYLDSTISTIQDIKTSAGVSLATAKAPSSNSGDVYKPNQIIIAEQSYKTVQIGNQVWMAKNLSIEVEDSCYYDNDPANCEKYGRLYTWEAAKKAASLVPGWHLPTDEEWKTLKVYLGMSAADADDIVGGGESGGVGTKLMEGGSSGFNALLAGHASSSGSFSSFSSLGNYGNFWSASPDGSSYAWSRHVGRGNAGVSRCYYAPRQLPVFRAVAQGLIRPFDPLKFFKKLPLVFRKV